MKRPRHGREAFVVVDPVQDYEETLVILGVYGSLRAAKIATAYHRRRAAEYEADRVTEVQHWVGGLLVETWEFRPGPRAGWKYLG